jgi:hypothetical protein
MKYHCNSQEKNKLLVMTRTDLLGDAPKPLLIASPIQHPAEHSVTFAASGTTLLPKRSLSKTPNQNISFGEWQCFH